MRMSGADAVDMDQQIEADPQLQPALNNKHQLASASIDSEPYKRQRTDASESSLQQSSPSLNSSPSPAGSSIFAPRLPDPLYVINTPDRGRCVYSSLTLPAHTALLRDAPIALIQFQKNKRRVLACSNCGAFIGSLAQQLDTLAATEGTTQPATQQTLAAAQLPAISAADQTLSSVVRCPAGCAELYCSSRCQLEQNTAYHQLLCLGPLHRQTHPRLSYNEKKARKVQRRAEARAGLKKQPMSPLLAFQRHAMRHHQFFLLAAQIVARLTLMERREEAIDGELQALREYAQKEWIATIDLDEGYDDEEEQKDNVGESETAHEEHNINAAKEQQQTADDGEEDEGYSAEDEGGQLDHEEDRRQAHRHLLLSHLTHVLTKSYHLLASALFLSVGLPTPHWYSVSFYSHLLGLLRMNNVAVELRNPLVEYVAAVDGLQSSDSWAEVASVVGERTMRVMEERRRKQEWERRNVEEEQQDDEEEEDGDEAGDNHSEQSNEEEWSDSEDDESFRKEDEDSFQPIEFSWPAPQPAAPAIVVVPAPIAQPILSSVPLADLPVQQPVAVLPGPTSGAAASVSSLSFSSTLFPSYHGSALYSSIACLNHSCDPNVVVHFDSDARPRVLTVGDGVRAGEECLMTYCDVDGVSRAERSKELQGYGFVCACQQCAREQEKETAEVDNQQAATASNLEPPH